MEPMATLSATVDFTLNGAALVAAHQPAIDRAIRLVRRQRRLSPDQADDLASDVYVRLLQHDGAVLRSYRGDSSLCTFLVVVVQRVLLDARIARDGKWRPSASARRLGRVAIELEQLVFRDGLTLTEASRLLRGRLGIDDTDDELHFLLMLLPPRHGRRLVGDDELEQRPAAGPDPEARLLEADAGPARAQLARALAGLPAEDRAIVRLRFAADLRLSDIARRRHLDEKAIYRRFQRTLATLRAAVAS
jgi:RNA polymerase sigma factor for flagellar operon FliA